MGKWRQSIVIPWLSSLQTSSAAYPWPMSWTRKCLLSMGDFSAVMVWNYPIYVQLIASGSLLMKVSWSSVLSWHILGWILYIAWFWIGHVRCDSDSFCCLVQLWNFCICIVRCLWYLCWFEKIGDGRQRPMHQWSLMMSCQLCHHSLWIPPNNLWLFVQSLCWIWLLSTMYIYSLCLYKIILCFQAWCANCYGVTHIQGWVEHQANEEWVLLLGLMSLIGFCKRTILVQYYTLLLQLFWLVCVLLSYFGLMSGKYKLFSRYQQ